MLSFLQEIQPLFFRLHLGTAPCYLRGVPGNAPSPIAVSTLDTRYLGIAGTASAFVVQGDGGAVLV